MKVSTIRELLVQEEENWGEELSFVISQEKARLLRKVIRIFEKTASIFLIFWKH